MFFFFSFLLLHVITLFFSPFLSKKNCHFLNRPTKVLGEFLSRTSGNGPNGQDRDRLLDMERSLDLLGHKLDVVNSRSSSPSVVYVGEGNDKTIGYGLMTSAGLGLIGCAYCYWKGYRLKDFYYVSQKAFDTCLESLRKNIADMGSLIGAVKEQLNERIGAVHESVETHIDASTEELKDELKNVEGDINSRLDGLDERLSMGNRGIFLLCEVLTTVHGGSVNNLPPPWRRLKEYTTENLMVSSIENADTEWSSRSTPKDYLKRILDFGISPFSSPKNASSKPITDGGVKTTGMSPLVNSATRLKMP